MTLSANQENGSEPIGAVCEIKYLSEGVVSSEYFSFAGLSEGDDECDAAGVHDDDIFYYANDGEDEIKSLMKQPFGGVNEFIVISYKLNYLHPSLIAKEAKRPRFY